MNIVLYMFAQLLRSGAYGLSARVRPLSAYKWSQLSELSAIHDVEDLLWRGIQRQTGNSQLNIPDNLREQLSVKASQSRHPMSERYSMNDVTLPGKRQNKQLRQIEKESLSKEEVTHETVFVFSLLAYNSERMLNTGFHLRGIIDLGFSLRSIGDKVDYVLLEHWIDQTSLRRMTQLQASILIDLFDFEADEFPFIHRQVKGAGMLAIKCLAQIDSMGVAEEARDGSYVSNNKNRFSKGLRRMSTYFCYSPTGSVRSMLNSLADGLSQIEE